MDIEEFTGYLAQLQDDEITDKNPIYEDLTNRYSDLLESQKAFSDEQTRLIQEKEAELSAQKAKNWDLLQKIPTTVEDESPHDENDSNDSPKSIDDLFE